MARLLIGFTLLIAVGSIVIVAAKVYFLGEGPQGQYRSLQVMPTAEGQQTSTGRS